jgi:hypothetical protein
VLAKLERFISTSAVSLGRLLVKHIHSRNRPDWIRACRLAYGTTTDKSRNGQAG